MEKRSSYEWNSDVEESPKEAVSTTVRVILLKDVKLQIVGQATGNVYQFSGAGSVLSVDKEDADSMISKYGGQCDCPSSVGKTPYFEIVR